MYPVSPEFVAEIRKGATIVTTADVYRLGQPLSGMQNIPIIDGSITVDPNAEVRRRCTVELDPAIDPVRYVPGVRFSEDYGLWPAGNEMNIKQTLKYRNGALGKETVNLGWYQISRPQVVDSGDDVRVTVEGWDLSRKYGRFPATGPMYIEWGTFVTDGIRRILGWTSPLLGDDDFDFDEVSSMDTEFQGNINLRFARLQFERGDNAWAMLAAACRTMGLDLEVTVDRKVRLRPIPYLLFSTIGLDPESAGDQPDATYEEGEYNIIESMSRSLDDQDAYNGVIFIAENSSNVPTAAGAVWDLDILSPTYYDPASPDSSAYGPHPKIVTDRWTSDEGDPELFAYFEFLRIRGILENVTIDAWPMFCHEPYDVLKLKRSRIGVDDNYLLESFTLGLGPDGKLDGKMRSRRLYK